MKLHSFKVKSIDVKDSDASAQEYTAVFAVKTPVQDHSGICHLIEHMVFRGSRNFPCSHELFVINHLLPAKINASTQNGYTFYFFTTSDLPLFYQLFEYLLHGLIETDYDETELSLERDGVLQQELQMYEDNEEYLLNACVLRGDSSPDSYFHYGGFTDTISANTLSRVKAYKHKYYQPSNITVLIAGRDIDSSLVDALLSMHKTSCSTSTSPYFPMRLAQSNIEDADRVVLTWRFHYVFLPSLKDALPFLKMHLPPEDKLYIDSELNAKEEVALRLVTTSPDTSQDIVTGKLQSLNASLQSEPFGITKLPNQIQVIIKQFFNSEGVSKDQLSSISGVNQCVSANKSDLLPIHPLNSCLTDKSAQLNASVVAERFSEIIALEHLPSLPKLFHAMAHQLTGENLFLNEGSHWLFRIDGSCHSELAGKMLAPEIWLPRLSGELYAMGVGSFEDQIYMYGAQDKNVEDRMHWCERIFN